MAADTVTVGDAIYAAADGELAKDADHVEKSTKVGKLLSLKDANDHMLIKLEL